MNYQFPPELAEKVDRLMASGKYKDENELVESALDALDAMETWLAPWKAEVEARIEEADLEESKPLDVDALMAEVRAVAPMKNAS
jgi:Arc/MetJ-type ribon-helix-helix transcriptional regulator